jgi:ADP-ribosylation factor GTPase-activating protein 2/3
MKVGGNESATKFFQRNGGSAALASKDPKVKYTSNAAGKYKDELARRVEGDMRKYVDIWWVYDDLKRANGCVDTRTKSRWTI